MFALLFVKFYDNIDFLWNAVHLCRNSTEGRVALVFFNLSEIVDKNARR